MRGAIRQAIAPGAVFATALLLRAPFASTYLWAWDSVLYAQAIGDFDVASGRPHPPGYLFYVLLSRLAATLLGDANAGLVAVSVVGGAAVCAVGFLIGSRLFGTRVGALAAAILIADPLLWHYSEVAYPYTILALLGGTVGTLLWWARSGSAIRPLAASLALGLAAGFRQDLLLLLGPLWLWTIAARGARTAALGVAALALGSLAWLVPTAALSGGLDRYLTATASQAVGLVTEGGYIDHVVDNLRLTAVGLRWQLLWALPLLPLGAWTLIRRPGLRFAAAPLLLWTTPALLTYLAFEIGEWAYTLSIAVPVALLAALGGAALIGVARGPVARGAVTAALAAALLLNAQSFVLGDGRFSATAIRGHDRGLALRIVAIRERFPSTETVLIARDGYQHTRFYLPEYRSLYLRAGMAPRRLPRLGPDVRRAVLFLDEARAHPRAAVRTVALVDGIEIRYIAIPRGARLAVLDELINVESE